MYRISKVFLIVFVTVAAISLPRAQRNIFSLMTNAEFVKENEGITLEKCYAAYWKLIIVDK